MSKPIQFAVFVAVVAMVIALGWVRWNLDTRVRALETRSKAAPAQGKAAPAAPLSTYTFTTDPFIDANLRKVYLKRPLTEKNAGVLAALQKRVSVPFDQDTPLSTFIEFIKTSTVTPERPKGVSIYVDPIGLQETEKTMESPILFGVADVTLSQALKSALKQIGMTYWVEDDGLVVIAAAFAKRDEESKDSDLEILKQIQQLRDEIAALRLETAAMRGALPQQPRSRGGMAGVPIGSEEPADFQ